MTNTSTAYYLSPSTTAWQNWAYGKTLYIANQAWGYWTGSTASTINPWDIQAPALPPSTPEQLQRAEVWKRDYEEAERKAHELLVRHISEEQVAQLDRDGYFEITADSDSVYRFHKDGTVRRLSWEGKAEFSYCIHSREGCPVGDEILAKKLLLQHDEKAFLKIANASRLYTPPPRIIVEPKGPDIIDIASRRGQRAA